LFEHQLVLCSARIITDLRPVFDDIADKILYFLPFHTLVIKCYEKDNYKYFHITIDQNDIKKLLNQLDRASKKENLLKENLKKAELKVIDTDAVSENI